MLVADTRYLIFARIGADTDTQYRIGASLKMILINFDNLVLIRISYISEPKLTDEQVNKSLKS